MTASPLRKGFRFGAFELDLQARELRKHGLRIKLQGMPFQVLTLLLRQPGEIISREELRRSLWPGDEYGEFDQSLNTAIKKLRQALGDSAGTPRFVETQARLGYRFIAPVQSIAEVAPQADTPPTVQEASTIPEASRKWPTFRWRTASVSMFLVCGLVLLTLGLWKSRMPFSRPGAGRISSIAVLPLINLSPGGGEQDYLADGLTEALITNLSQVSALRVISRTSVMQYKHVHKMLPEIGRELKVDGIVEGALRRSGSRVRVDVKLIHAATEKNVWAEVYERDLEDVVSLENEIAGAIANRTVPMTSRESGELSRSRRLSPEVYDAYLRGRFFWNTRSKDGLQKAIKYFERAVARDPKYPLGYVGLADCYNVLSYYGSAKPKDSFPRAKTAAQKALELDGNVAEAHAALGYAFLHFDWDWAGADAEFRRALMLNPGYANALHWQSHYFLAVGRTQDALAAARRALQLDPLDQGINAHLGHHLIYVERYDEAIAQMHNTLEMNPDSARSHALLARAYEGKGMFSKARSEFREAIRLSGDDGRFRAGLAHVYAREGNLEEATRLLSRLEQESLEKYISPYALAEVHAALGKPDRAFENLALACDQRDEQLIYLKTDPNLKTLRADARFNEIVRRIRLPL